MALGFDVEEDDRSYEVEGITGTVARYSTENMQFPCFVVCMDEEHPVEQYRVEVLKRMFQFGQNLGEDEEGIGVYFHAAGKTLRLGRVVPSQVKPFLQLFEGCLVDGYYDKDTHLEGDYLYVLSN